MRYCYPEIFEQINEAEDGCGYLRNHLCKLGQPKCIVPGHTFEIYEAERIENKRKKEAERKLKAETKQAERKLKAKWNIHDDKLKGGDYTREDIFDTIDMEKEHIKDLVKKLEEEFDQYPDGPYGIQEAMGMRDDWLHWSLQLAQVWSRTKDVCKEYQMDISANIKTLDRLGEQTSQGYQGSHDYIRALHCIFHDAFDRCYLPSPPFLNLQHAINLRDGDGGCTYKSRMRSFQGYKFRAFGMIKVVIDSPLTTRKEVMNQDTNEEADINAEKYSTERESLLPEIKRASERQNYESAKRDRWDDSSNGSLENTYDDWFGAYDSDDYNIYDSWIYNTNNRMY